MATQKGRNMKFINTNLKGKPTLVVRKGRSLVNLAVAAPKLPRDLKGILDMGDKGLAAVKQAIAKPAKKAIMREADLVHLPPIMNPSKILCLGVNYADHAKEMKSAKPSFPVIFARHSSTLVAHNGAMIRPAASEQLDYEAEMVAIIGRPARHVSMDDALDYVAGYSCFNDGSIREWQNLSSQWTLGKNFDGTGAFGPEFVTADELPAGGRGLKISCKLNGKVMQRSNTKLMMFDVAEAISIISQAMTLYPGDLIVSGTPGGVGAARKPPVWMKAGDKVEVEVENVGKLVNTIANEAPTPTMLNQQTAPKN
jgi:2-keto-4-pentenoate hydratase/2-oxohepta-3-ene-1,7-dioic acid hydratase in catechol pathway